MFLTDGFIGNEAQIFAGAANLVGRARKSESRARVFGIGIGSAPNRELIAGLSRAGDGAALYVSNREHPGAAVDGYFRYVDHPVLELLSVDWGGLAVEDVYPNNHLNLFASRSVVVHGRYRGELPTQVTLSATLPGTRERVQIPVTIAAGDTDDRILTTLWARAKLADLDAASWDGDLSAERARDAVTRIGLQYHLVTAYTSFVAVDRSRVIGDGRPELLTQPVEVPEDVDPIMSGMSLAGSTGAESKYTVEGANVSDPAFGTVGASIVTEFVQEANATLRIKRLSVSEGVDERAIKRALKAHAHKLEACYEQRVSAPGKRRLRYRLRFDARGQLLDLELLDGSLGPDANACVDSILLAVSWRGLPSAEANVTIELQLQM
jgi:Ca-activated chloride channel family protein